MLKELREFGIGGGIPVARLGIWRSYDEVHDEGLVKILLEGQINFDVANYEKDLGNFDVIIIPGVACLDRNTADRLNQFTSNGGSLVVMGSGALDVDGGEVILNIGADYEGPAEFDSDYLLLKDSLSGSLLRHHS